MKNILNTKEIWKGLMKEPKTKVMNRKQIKFNYIINYMIYKWTKQSS